jgi:hypothetical protein
MKRKPLLAIGSSLLLALIGLLLINGTITAGDKKPKPSICANPHPEQLCTAANTCGSTSSPCVLEIRRTGGGYDASVTPNIQGFPKEPGPICIAPGTSVTWKGEGKNTGIMINFASSSPFDPPGLIMGGSDRPVTVQTKNPGCYKYTVGACNPGSIYGMCGNSDFDLIVTGAK